jgi:hypothetical protein
VVVSLVDDLHKQIDSLIQKTEKKKKGIVNYLILCIVCGCLGGVLALPLFEHKPEENIVETILEEQLNKNVGDIVWTEDSGVYNYWTVNQSNVFGRTSGKIINDSYVMDWASQYFTVFLNASTSGNTGTYTINASEGLTQDVNWTNENGSFFAKMTWTINTSTAPIPLYYALTFAIDSRCVNFINGTWNDNHSVTFDIPFDNETVSFTFNWSDLIPLIQNNQVYVKRKTVTRNNQEYFIFRVFSVNAINPNVLFEIDPLFGYTGASGACNYGLSNYQMGAWYECNFTGTLDNISLYCQITEPFGGKITCAIYDYVDYGTDYAGNQRGVTDERVWTTTFSSQWQVFNFSEPKPSVTSGTKYYLLAWGNRTDSNNDIKWRYDTNEPGAWDLIWDSEGGYLPWEDPLTGEASGNGFHNMSIYATGTESGDGESWNQNFSGYWLGGNISQWTQNFSGYFTGGNDTVTWNQNFSGYWLGGNISQWTQNFSGYFTGGNGTVSWNQNFSGYWLGGNVSVAARNWQQNFTGWFSGGNTSRLWTQNFTGWFSGGNGTITWTQNFSGWWSGGNISRTWQQNFSGFFTGGNVSQIFDIVLEYPTNQSTILSPQPTLYFNITHPTAGKTLNYTLYVGNSTANLTVVYTGNNVSVGRQMSSNHLHGFATTFYHNHHWKVEADDGSTYCNRSFYFQVSMQGGGGITSFGAALAVATGSIMLAVVALFMGFEKRRRR